MDTYITNVQLVPSPVKGSDEVIKDSKLIAIRPVPMVLARQLVIRHHYLHSFPGGTHLSFGVFVDYQLLGAVILGSGPYLGYRLVESAVPDDCLTMTRLWLSDDLPCNSESSVIARIIKSLRHYTSLKFLLTYADPLQGHVGVIYQASNWLYTGLSQPMAQYDLGNGRLQHSRSLAHAFGTHSVRYLTEQGIEVKRVSQAAKHRYIYFLDRHWLNRLTVPVLPYPKRGET
jgi:hypothetical protein